MNLSPTQSPDALRPVVTRWVGQSFFGTLMKGARASSLGPEDSPFTGGRGGKAFREMLDGRLAEAAGRGAGKPLVDSIVRRISGTHQLPPAPAPSVPPTTSATHRGILA